MKICCNTANIPIIFRKNANLAYFKRIKNTNISFNGDLNKVTKVNLIDFKTGEKIEADLIEKPFDGIFMENEIRVNGKKAGFAKISVSPKTVNVPLIYKQNGFLYVNLMENSSKGKYKGVGTELLKSVVRRSDDFGFDGRVALTAAKNAHTFHYKFGFEPYSSKGFNKEAKKILNEEIKKKEPHCEYLGHIDMYLSKEKIDEVLCI